jgi:hypothetical protein
MKKYIFYSLLLFLCVHGTGCVSMHVIDKAQGTPPKRKDAQPAYYTLLPLTVPLDAALGMFLGFLWLESNSHDDDYGYSYSPSSSRDGGLKVKRP